MYFLDNWGTTFKHHNDPIMNLMRDKRIIIRAIILEISSARFIRSYTNGNRTHECQGSSFRLSAMRNDLWNVLSQCWDTEDQSGKADSHQELENHGVRKREYKDQICWSLKSCSLSLKAIYWQEFWNRRWRMGKIILSTVKFCTRTWMVQ